MSPARRVTWRYGTEVNLIARVRRPFGPLPSRLGLATRGRRRDEVNAIRPTATVPIRGDGLRVFGAGCAKALAPSSPGGAPTVWAARTFSFRARRPSISLNRDGRCSAASRSQLAAAEMRAWPPPSGRLEVRPFRQGHSAAAAAMAPVSARSWVRTKVGARLRSPNSSAPSRETYPKLLCHGRRSNGSMIQELKPART